MSQEDSKVQKRAKLYKDRDVDWLEFELGSGKIHRLNINLEDNQGDIKAMFCDLIEMLEGNAVELEFEVAEGYDNKLLIEVSEAYVKDLNKELENVRSEILDKYTTDDEE